MMDSAMIQKRFNKAHNSYDQHCQIQNSACEHLISQLPKQYQQIADFGCGTGESTKQLATHFPNATITGYDACDQLLTTAKNKLSNTSFFKKNFDETITLAINTDCIFSNMALQWAKNLEATLSYYKKRKLTLAFSLTIEGNFPELIDHSKPKFLAFESIQNIIQRHFSECIYASKKSYTLTFNSYLNALRHIKAIGANCAPSHHQGLKRINPRNFFISTQPTLTYQIGYFIARND